MTSSSSSLHLAELSCRSQQYEWGKHGLNSAVAKLLNAQSQNNNETKVVIEEKTPYAELWMGTHPSAPSLIKSSSQTLRDYISTDLPYLFKVLSVRTALSIQAHPDKDLAKKLHSENPKEYKDDNHKPELACAVTDFEALCGFRPAKQIANYLETVPELVNVVGSDNSQQFLKAVQNNDENSIRTQLKSVFSALMQAQKESFVSQLQNLINRINNDKPSDINATEKNQINVYNLILRLNTQYPNDIGIFAPFLLNAFSCAPGEAVFLAANEPHAYLSGDIIEVMACSDNVVRAGLTPKFRDVNNLCNMLTYKLGLPPVSKGVEDSEPYVTYYPAPVPEFALRKYNFTATKSKNQYKLASMDSHSIALVYSGSGKFSEQGSEPNDLSVSMGSIILIPQRVAVNVQVDQDMILFRCSANTANKAPL